MALLSPSDWKAEWIGLDQEGYPQRSITLRKDFLIKKEVVLATTYVSGLGGYVFYINGKKVSDDLLTPGWTVFGKRIPYQTYDVTGYLKNGENAFGAVLGNNWWASNLHGQSSFVYYSEEPLRFIMQTLILYADSTADTIITDGSWKAKMAPKISILNENELPAISKNYFFTGKGKQKGLKSELFENIDLAGKAKLVRCDTIIDFNFEGNAPDTLLPKDNFSCRWSGYLEIPETKTYKLVTWSDDGVRLFFDGKKVIDNWNSHALQIDTFTVFLEKGSRHKLILEYFDSHYGAVIKLGWDHLDEKYLALQQQKKEMMRYPVDGSASFSPVIHNSIYEGEIFDARLDEKGWKEAGFDESKWSNVCLFESPDKILFVPAINNPIRVSEKLKPILIKPIHGKKYVFDFGQNLAGVAQLNVQGKLGDTIRIRFGELLNSDGSVNQLNLGKATSTDVYILKGDSAESWAPSFTYHGFRYAEVSGLRYKPDTNTLTALAFIIRMSLFSVLILQIRCLIKWPKPCFGANDPTLWKYLPIVLTGMNVLDGWVMSRLMPEPHHI
ncbi:MAG: family 78 glycoside hydrolase catalytic domain [Bacteroidales bacterium]|nr:family 78 glycoside hydrolase catalytic domain [Bacteroidales bacterium]